MFEGIPEGYECVPILAQTGSSAWPLVLVGLAAVAIGITITVLARRHHKARALGALGFGVLLVGALTFTGQPISAQAADNDPCPEGYMLVKKSGATQQTGIPEKTSTLAPTNTPTTTPTVTPQPTGTYTVSLLPWYTNNQGFGIAENPVNVWGNPLRTGIPVVAEDPVYFALADSTGSVVRAMVVAPSPNVGNNITLDTGTLTSTNLPYGTYTPHWTTTPQTLNSPYTPGGELSNPTITAINHYWNWEWYCDEINYYFTAPTDAVTVNAAQPNPQAAFSANGTAPIVVADNFCGGGN